MLRHHGKVHLWSDEAALESRLNERDRSGRLRSVAVEPVGFQAGEVVGGALPLPPAGECDDRPIARADEFLELGLGFSHTASGEVGGLRAKRETLVLIDARQTHVRPAGEGLLDVIGRDI